MMFHYIWPLQSSIHSPDITGMLYEKDEITNAKITVSENSNIVNSMTSGTNVLITGTLFGRGTKTIFFYNLY